MELEIVRFFNQLGYGTFIDTLTILVSNLYFLIVFWGILTFLIIVLDKKQGKWVALTLVLSIIIFFVLQDVVLRNLILPHIFTRLRPYLALPDEIFPLGVKVTDSSFPSGHIASTTAILTILIYHYRRYWPLALIFVLLMAFARMHNGIHYPSDILGGMVLGILYGLLAIFITNKIRTKLA